MQKNHYNFRLSDEAELDVDEGFSWYESRRQGLGELFLESLDRAKAAIISDPKAYQTRYKRKVRGFVVDRFPYLIMYIVSGENIDVISVFNTHQHPQKWKKRVQ